jgi:thymidylate kinase
VEGRTQFNFLPESIKIYIDVEINEAAKRIFNDLKANSAKRNEGNLRTLEEVKKIYHRERSQRSGPLPKILLSRPSQKRKL